MEGRHKRLSLNSSFDWIFNLVRNCVWINVHIYIAKELIKNENSVYTNKKVQKAVLEISNCDSVEIYFDLQKYAGFLPSLTENIKDTISRYMEGEYGKWFEMIEPYDCDLKEFIEIIEDNKIDKLDDKLDLHYHRTTDFGLGEIEWENDEVPDDIKDAFYASYGDDGKAFLMIVTGIQTL